MFHSQEVTQKAEVIPFIGSDDFTFRMDDDYSKLVKSYMKAKKKAREAEQLQEEAKKELLKVCEGRNTRGCGVTITKVTRAGSVDLKAIPELQGIDLDKYRKESVSYWSVT